MKLHLKYNTKSDPLLHTRGFFWSLLSELGGFVVYVFFIVFMILGALYAIIYMFGFFSSIIIFIVSVIKGIL